MKNIFLIISISFLIVGCAYKPLINPETSKDPATGENIAGNYWKDLHACRYIFEQNTGKLAVLPDEKGFIKKCMEDYGYAILR
tara:strand:+ start:149 stop:397 length:249 start_codon:yes stop_codon:yes gene_type:complete